MSKASGFFRELLSWIVYLVLWMGVIFAIYHWVAQPFQVDGSSMEHTLEDGQKLWMVKLASIDRFDVVIFPEPMPAQCEKPRLYVKRVIGMPGDTIEVRNDQLVINGQAMEEPYLKQKATEYFQEKGDVFTQDFSLEALTGQTTVPEGKLFVMGDNRRNSLDGRAFGFINAEDVLGEADFIYWPLSDIGLLKNYELNEAGTAIINP